MCKSTVFLGETLTDGEEKKPLETFPSPFWSPKALANAAAAPHQVIACIEYKLVFDTCSLKDFTNFAPSNKIDSNLLIRQVTHD